MRRGAVIAGVLVLTAAFAAAWFVLGPTGDAQRDRDMPESTSAVRPGGSPLEADNRELAACAGDASEPGASTEGALDAPEPRPGSELTQPPGETTAGETPTTRADATSALQPDGTTARGTPTTRDGGTPAESVPRPLSIHGRDRPPGQNLGNTRPRARVIAKPTGVKSLDEVSEKLMQDRRGLYAEYYQVFEEDLPPLEMADPALVRIDRQVYFPDAEAFSDLPVTLDNFAAVWTGFLVVPEHGDYWLFWGADNGGRVELDGETVLLQDGMVRYVEVSAVLTLAPGLHPLRIEFAQEHNSVADWAKCAANFMYVPQGQTKPVPVPPEMLMVPEWMWSDNAPIITNLSKYEGEIGDEITIYGEGFSAKRVSEEYEFEHLVTVTFAGQQATVLDRSNKQLSVRVPIGAKTGDLIVYRASPSIIERTAGQPWKVATWERAVPSNSIDFTVTTQFGLMAEWHNLEGWSNFGFEVFDGELLPEADTVRLETNPGYAERPDSASTGVVVWNGRIGIPSFNVSGKKHAADFNYQLSFASYQRCQVTANGQTLLAEASGVTSQNTPYPYECDFQFAARPETYFEIRIELIDDTEVAPKWLMQSAREDTGYAEVRPQFYFPPVVPPKPPEITRVVPYGPDEELVPPPYDVDESRPSVRVGQDFVVDVVVSYGEKDFAALADMPAGETHWAEFSIDQVPLSASTRGWVDRKDGCEMQRHRFTMPTGVGGGKLTARLGMSTSDPFLLDITNRGLVAYLYDVPDGSGLAKLPDLGPLTCFKVRKDRAINFESAASFDLPFPAETFVIEWLGGLIIEEEGDYTFTCRSDDGMKLWLDDNVVLDADKLQAPAENSATVHLVPGTYRFRMQFFENNQHEVCVLEWQASRNETVVIPREVIPARAFTLDTHPPFPNKTSTGKRTDGS